MAIGNSYPIKSVVEDYDLFLGTRNGTNTTVNYTAQAVVDYLNTSASIAIGGQLTFIFSTNEYEAKSMFFSGGGGNNTSFSSITQLLISNVDCSGNNTNIFLEYLEGTDILISRQNYPNIFGHYKITGYTVTINPGFYTLDLEYIGGNGNIEEDVYYNINSFVLSYNSPIPTLQQVTDSGNITTTTVILDGGATSNSINEIATFQPGSISTVNTNTGSGVEIAALGYVGLSNDGIGWGYIGAEYVTGEVLLQIPNKPTGTYTIATTSDLSTGYIPYVGATQNVDLGEYELKAGQLTLDTTPTGTSVVGTTQWNDTAGVSETKLKGGNVILKNGIDLVARVVNKVTPNTTLLRANYTAVRISGAQGQRLAVAYAQANNDNNSADTLGLVYENIATNQEGFIMTMGQFEEINTTGSLQGETWSDGDVLYLSPTTAGRITNIKPTGLTGHIVVMGYVEYAHAIHGKIYVKIMNGWELDELHNVYINQATLANNDGLFYDSSDQLWKNETIASALGYTPANKAGDTFTGNIDAPSMSIGGTDLESLMIAYAVALG